LPGRLSATSWDTSSEVPRGPGGLRFTGVAGASYALRAGGGFVWGNGFLSVSGLRLLCSAASDRRCMGGVRLARPL